MRSSLQAATLPMEVTPVDRPRSTTVNLIDRQMEWLGLVARAFGRSGLSHKEAAFTMGVDPGQLSAQLSGVPGKHLSFRKLGMLGPEFWQELVDMVLEFHGLSAPGLTAQDQEDLRVGRLMREIVQRSAAR